MAKLRNVLPYTVSFVPAIGSCTRIGARISERSISGGGSASSSSSSSFCSPLLLGLGTGGGGGGGNMERVAAAPFCLPPAPPFPLAFALRGVLGSPSGSTTDVYASARRGFHAEENFGSMKLYSTCGAFSSASLGYSSIWGAGTACLGVIGGSVFHCSSKGKAHCNGNTNNQRSLLLGFLLVCTSTVWVYNTIPHSVLERSAAASGGDRRRSCVLQPSVKAAAAPSRTTGCCTNTKQRAVIQNSTGWLHSAALETSSISSCAPVRWASTSNANTFPSRCGTLDECSSEDTGSTQRTIDNAITERVSFSYNCKQWAFLLDKLHETEHDIPFCKCLETECSLSPQVRAF